MKAATKIEKRTLMKFRISIHAAREGGDEYQIKHGMTSEISIHAAREGGDHFGQEVNLIMIRFQSTPPVKAATLRQKCTEKSAIYFNPRRP